LASAIIPDNEANERARAKRIAKQARAELGEQLTAAERQINLIQMPLATDSRTQLRLVFSNNGAASVGPGMEVGRAELYAVGPTPYLWSRYPRSLVRGLQKNLFTTARMPPLIIIGVVLLTITRQRRALAILLAVPVYYVCTQSTLHKEYRYILAI
jgi:hypothetical protein